MRVELLHHTPLWICSEAIRKSRDIQAKRDTDIEAVREQGIYALAEAGDRDKELIARIGNKMKHKSVLEHLVYSFDIDGVSRALLQELARHRIASLTVKSTRYTLKELKDEKPFNVDIPADHQRAYKYIVMTTTSYVNNTNIKALEQLRQLLKLNIGNDIAKYSLPESYRTSLIWTINARSLQNFLMLRSHKDALWEIQLLAQEVYNALPSEHKYLFKEFFKLIRL